MCVGGLGSGPPKKLRAMERSQVELYSTVIFCEFALCITDDIILEIDGVNKARV